MDFSERIATAPTQSLASYNRPKGSRMWARANDIPPATTARCSIRHPITSSARFADFDQFLIC
jgi:hypothetical protein